MGRRVMTLLFNVRFPFTTSRSFTPDPTVVLFVRSKVSISPGDKVRSPLKVRVPGLLPGEITLVPEPVKLPTTVPLPLRLWPEARVKLPLTAETSKKAPPPTRMDGLPAIEPERPRVRV